MLQNVNRNYPHRWCGQCPWAVVLQNNPRAYGSPVLNRSQYCAVAKHKSLLVLLQRDSCHVFNVTITCTNHGISIKLFIWLLWP